jgi:hypothetical protein
MSSFLHVASLDRKKREVRELKKTFSIPNLKFAAFSYSRFRVQMPYLVVNVTKTFCSSVVIS